MEGATDRKRADSGTQEKLWTLRYQQQRGSVSLTSKACSTKKQLLITSSLYWGLIRCWLIVLLKSSLHVYQLSTSVRLREKEAEVHKLPTQGHTVHLHYQ